MHCIVPSQTRPCPWCLPPFDHLCSVHSWPLGLSPLLANLGLPACRKVSLIPMEQPVLPESTHLTCNSNEFLKKNKTKKKTTKKKKFLKKEKIVYSNTSPPGLIWAVGLFLLCDCVKQRQDIRGETPPPICYNWDVLLISQKHLWIMLCHGLHQPALGPLFFC